MEKMDLLEEKIRKAADTIRGLREERGALEGQLRTARAEKGKPTSRSGDPERDRRLEKLTRERQVIAERVDQMLKIIEEAEAS